MVQKLPEEAAIENKGLIRELPERAQNDQAAE
jgi:hypothetical protein